MNNLSFPNENKCNSNNTMPEFIKYTGALQLITVGLQRHNTFSYRNLELKDIVGNLMIKVSAFVQKKNTLDNIYRNVVAVRERSHSTKPNSFCLKLLPYFILHNIQCFYILPQIIFIFTVLYFSECSRYLKQH